MYSPKKKGILTSLRKMIWKNKTNEFDKSIKEINKSEMERITQELIEELVGKHGVISNCLNSLLESYNAKNNPIGRDEAKTILLVLIRIGVTKRRRLSQKVYESLEHGRLFQYYNNRLSQIDRLTEDAFLAMKEMQLAREKFEREKNIYEKISGKAYDRSIDLKDSSNDTADKKVEMWNELDKEIEINYNENEYNLLKNNYQPSYADESNFENSNTHFDNPVNPILFDAKTNLTDYQQQTTLNDIDDVNANQECSNEQITPSETNGVKIDQKDSIVQVNPNDITDVKNRSEDQAQVTPNETTDEKTDRKDSDAQIMYDENSGVEIRQGNLEAQTVLNETTDVKTDQKDSNVLITHDEAASD